MSYLSFLLLLFCLVGGSLISAVGHFRRSAVLDTVFVTLLVLTLVCLTLNYDSYQFHELHLLEDPNFLAARLSLLVLVVGGAYDLIKKTGLALHKLISFVTCFLMIWIIDIFNVFDLGNPLADTPDTYLMDSAIMFGSMALGVFLINTWLTHREARILQ